MLVVKTVARIRREFYVKGKPIKEIVRSLGVKPMLSFGVSRTTTIDLGYQIVYMDYESGTGTDRFAYDVPTEGPIIGASFQL